MRLPADEAPHDVLAEWWYYTGHLYAEGADDEYGFELVFFRGIRGARPPGYAAHFAVSDVSRRRFAYDQRQDVALREPRAPVAGATRDAGGSRDAGVVALVPPQGGFDLLLGDWAMRGAQGQDALHATGGGYALQLDVTATKPPALHSGSPPLQPGLISFGPAGYSYYYSRTRMNASGTLAVEGVGRRVTGSAWMDHQWGDFLVLGAGGWDWLAVNMSDGRDLTISIIRNESGAVVLSYGTVVAARGEARHVPPGSFSLDALARWTSLRTGVSYPSGWRLRLPADGLDLTLTPLLPDQELDARASTGVIYWEGAVAVSDAAGRDAGRGYVELTGYK